MLCLVTQLCLTLCDPLDCSLPGSSVHGDFLGKNTGVGCHVLLQWIFPTQGLNPGLLHYRWILYCLSHMIKKIYGGGLVAMSCPTLCNPMDCSLPGSSVQGIFQTRMLAWVAISFSRGSSWSRDWTWVSCIEGGFFTNWATREAPKRSINVYNRMSYEGK